MASSTQPADDSLKSTTRTKMESSSNLDSKSNLEGSNSSDGDAAFDESDQLLGHHEMRKGQGWGRGVKGDVKRTIAKHWKEEMTNFNGKVCVSWMLNKLFL